MPNGGTAARRAAAFAMWKLFLIAVFSAAAATPAFARPPIHEILAKGSEWELNVDGRSGVLQVLGGRSSPDQGGGWALTLEVAWDGRPGTLEGRSFADETVQAVTLELTGPDGVKLTARGYIARESGDFMSGISTYRVDARDLNGAWYATRRETAATAAGSAAAAAPAPQTDGAAAAAPGTVAGPAAPAEAQQAAVRLCRVAGTISGRLELVGQVAAFAQESGEPIATARPRSDGSFELEPLPDGRYRIAPRPAGPFELVMAPQLRRIDCVGAQEHRVEFQVLGTVDGRQ